MKCKRRIKLNFYGKKKSSDTIFDVYLENLNINSLEHTCANYILSFRNCENYSNYWTKQSSLYFYSKASKYSSNPISFNKNDYNKYIKPLIKNKKIVIGTYIRVSNCKKFQKYLGGLKRSLEDNISPNKVVDEDYYEWIIEDFNKIKFDKVSPKFIIGGNEWSISFKSNNSPVYTSVYLKNLTNSSSNKNGLYIKYVIAARNCNDYFCFEAKNNIDIQKFTPEKNIIGFDEYLTKNELYNINKNTQSSIINNKRLIIGVFVRVYCDKLTNNDLENKPTVKDNISQYDTLRKKFVNYLQNYMHNNNKVLGKVINEGYFEWIIEDWKKLKNLEFSPDFTVGKHK
eukprot:jgi/Orpsp1_1/1185080/evm.model.c7180000092230.1